ncbi:MAG TPA: hypothetical protein VJK52_04800, partial [Candidatus Nanoarchaeia archaeon]|nr:hypothetical protein [Candidatus Nanoarchaeia archaeon]
MGNSQQTVLEALAEGDLVEQVGTIVRHMTNLRRRQLAEELPPQDQDLYLHCAVQLAARLRTIESEDTDYRRRVLKVMNALDTDSRLLQYDPCQDGYWERQNPNFVTGLERVTIGTLLDQYSAPDNRHAVLQAIKYRTVDERPITFDEKQAMLNTIRARQGRVPSFTRQGIVRKMLGTLFGTSLQMEDDPNDPNTLIIPSGDFSVIDSVLNEAAEMGYRRIQLHFPNDRHFDALLQALQVMLPKDAPLTEDEVRTKSVPGLLIYRNVEYVPVTITVPPPVPELPLSPPRWAFPFFSRLAQLPVSPTAEQSLRFSTLNFHSFGLQFAQELGT